MITSIESVKKLKGNVMGCNAHDKDLSLSSKIHCEHSINVQGLTVSTKFDMDFDH